MAGVAVPDRSDSGRFLDEREAGTRAAAGGSGTLVTRSFEAATHELLSMVERAVGRIERGEGVEAALRELWATLLELKAIVERNLGIRMAADDLYAAAATLVAGQGAGPWVVDLRRWRLLREATSRLRARLA